MLLCTVTMTQKSQQGFLNTLICLAIQQFEQLLIKKLSKSSKATNADETESTCPKVSIFCFI